jgi:tryptophanyl-tRNA synthetase
MFESEDRLLIKRLLDCKNGKILCGLCKNQLLDSIKEFQQNHLERKNACLTQAKEIVHQIS